MYWLVLFLLRSTLVFILLLNVSFQENCDNRTVKQIHITEGVWPFYPWWLPTYTPELRAVVMRTFGVMSHQTYIKAPTIFLPANWDEDCPAELRCRSIFMLQNLRIGASDLNWTNESGFLTLTSAPIYDLVIEWAVTMPPERDTTCRSYKSDGWPFELILCARDESHNNETYVTICKSYLEMIVML